MLDRVWETAGPIDGLVNNAGIIRRADSVDFSETDWDDVMDVNLKSVFFLCQAFAEEALAAGRSGRIVNIASVLSFQGGIRVAVLHRVKAWRARASPGCSPANGRPKGINVNASRRAMSSPTTPPPCVPMQDRSAAILARIPAGRWGDPSDIGDAVVFLLAPASAYMHGAVVPVDGGWLVR